MNRSMYEIDHGFIPETFRDGPNPHKHEKPLQMSRESHGFAFHLQSHDSFTTQLDTRHPRWKEAAANLLTVMNRPVLIHGRLVSIRTDAKIGTHWGEDMIPWDGKDVFDLDRIVTSQLTSERKVA